MCTVLRAIPVLTQLMLSTPFENEETEAQRNEIICLSHTAHGVPEIQTQMLMLLITVHENASNRPQSQLGIWP